MEDDQANIAFGLIASALTASTKNMAKSRQCGRTSASIEFSRWAPFLLRHPAQLGWSFKSSVDPEGMRQRQCTRSFADVSARGPRRHRGRGAPSAADPRATSTKRRRVHAVPDRHTDARSRRRRSASSCPPSQLILRAHLVIWPNDGLGCGPASPRTPPHGYFAKWMRGTDSVPTNRTEPRVTKLGDLAGNAEFERAARPR